MYRRIAPACLALIVLVGCSSKPPVSQPTTSQPPATQPPTTQPPTSQPSSEPAASQPPAIQPQGPGPQPDGPAPSTGPAPAPSKKPLDPVDACEASLPAPPAEATITIVQDGVPQTGKGLQANGTFYTPLEMCTPQGDRIGVANNLVYYRPGYTVDLTNSQWIMRAGTEPITPRVQYLNERVYLPITEHVFSHYDSASQTLYLTSIGHQWAPVTAADAPADVRAALTATGTGLRGQAFHHDQNTWYFVFGYPDSGLRFTIDNSSSGYAGLNGPVLTATPRANGDPEVLAAVQFSYFGTFNGFLLNFPIPDPLHPSTVFIGRHNDPELYEREASGTVAPDFDRSKPQNVIAWYGFILGSEQDHVTYTDHGTWVEAAFTHAGQPFTAHVIKKEKGYVLEGVTWGADCSQFLYCPPN